MRLLSETFSKKFSNIVAQLENLISLAFLCCLTLNLTELTHQCRPSKVLLLQLLSSYFFLSRLKLWNNFFTLTDIDTVYLSFLLKKKSRASACHKERDGRVQLIFLLRIVHDIPTAQFSACIYKENFLHNKVFGFLNKKGKKIEHCIWLLRKSADFDAFNKRKWTLNKIIKGPSNNRSIQAK